MTDCEKVWVEHWFKGDAAWIEHGYSIVLGEAVNCVEALEERRVRHRP